MQLGIFTERYLYEQSRETLIKWFKYGHSQPPYLLSYHYRTKEGRFAHKRDFPTLQQMIEDGEVKVHLKTNTQLLYEYITDGET